MRSATSVIAEGVVLVVLGVLAIFLPPSLATALTLAFPLFLAVKGVLEMVAAFRAQGEGGATWGLAFGVIAVLAAVLLFARPTLLGITPLAILAGYFFVEGVVRLAIGFMARGPAAAWVWVLAVGVLDVVLGLYLVAAPAPTLTVIAFLIGLDILATGIATIIIGTLERSRRVPTGVTPA